MAKENIAFLELVWELVHSKVLSGDVTTRHDLAAFLKAQGFKARCETYAGKPLQQPVILAPGGNQLRLTGSVYYRPDFGKPAALVVDRNDPVAVAARLEILMKNIRAGLEFKAYWTVGRLFGVGEQRRIKLGKARTHLSDLMAERLRVFRPPEPAHPVFSAAKMNDVALMIQSTPRRDKTIMGLSALTPRREEFNPTKEPQITPEEPTIEMLFNPLGMGVKSANKPPEKPSETQNSPTVTDTRQYPQRLSIRDRSPQRKREKKKKVSEPEQDPEMG